MAQCRVHILIVQKLLISIGPARDHDQYMCDYTNRIFRGIGHRQKPLTRMVDYNNQTEFFIASRTSIDSHLRCMLTSW